MPPADPPLAPPLALGEVPPVPARDSPSGARSVVLHPRALSQRQATTISDAE